MDTVTRCSTPDCRETEGLETMEGGAGRFCPACRVEITLKLAALDARKPERDARYRGLGGEE